MSSKSISQQNVTKFKDQLDFLQCPYTEEIDAVATADLLFSPGEERLKILIWIFSRFDPSLLEFLNNVQPNVGRKPDVLLQKLLTAAHCMCLCSRDDIALIKGEAPSQKQNVFYNRLLNILCIGDQEDLNYNGSESHKFLDNLAGKEDVFDPVAWKLDLIPKDIQSEVKRLQLKKEQDKNNSPCGVPELCQLTSLSQSLSDEIDKNNKNLEELQKIVQVQTLDKTSEIVTMSQMLWTVLRELRQLVAGFTHCYESNIGVWCMKKPPQLSQLGASFKRVHGLLEKFSALFEDVNSIRQLHSKLANNDMSGEFKQQLLVQASRNTSESFQKCLSILEETLHRTESNFKSQFTDILTV